MSLACSRKVVSGCQRATSATDSSYSQPPLVDPEPVGGHAKLGEDRVRGKTSTIPATTNLTEPGPSLSSLGLGTLVLVGRGGWSVIKHTPFASVRSLGATFMPTFLFLVLLWDALDVRLRWPSKARDRE
ncbi:cell division protein FtsK [Anopheles sinensis]|uniref:Cell division protein FtsK n=1 Tax=Anopheles sinensis TaxID=74873 RepID=A0A084W4J0_ANOSI|nr:cell division protein FtsK [Anopheles sinensis]